MHYLKAIIAVTAILSFSAQASIIADVWITKYALTRGIYKEKVTLESGGMIAFTDKRYYKLSELAFTQEDANFKAEQMRKKEIARLKGKLSKLQSISFVGRESR